MKTLLLIVLTLLVCVTAWAGEPCCEIKAIDIQTGIITAAINQTGTTFRFSASPAVARSMKVGQAVYADFKTGAVTVQGITQHFSISASPVSPCCEIVGIDAAHGVANARVSATGTTFQVIFDPTGPVNGFKAGQAFDVNFQTGVAAIGGRNFRVLSTAAGMTKVYGGEPCCQVKAIDGASRTLTLVGAGGRAFQVRVTNPAALSAIKVGSKLYANSRLDIFSVDSASPCCAIVVP